MTDNFLKAQAFKLKGRLYTFTVLELFSTDILLFEQQLADVVLKAPKMFENSPVVLDCSELKEQDTALCLDDFFQCLRVHGLLPVAIQGANPLLSVIAQSQGIAVLNGSRAHDRPLHEGANQEGQEGTVPADSGLEAQEQAPQNPNKLVINPVRSGQQVVCKGGDLIISSSVSHGAELLADGNIHVYGVLRGRALAGINGDKNARIFCKSLEAELISIAGFYRLSDAIEPCAYPCQIYLEGEHICIEPLG